MFEIDDRFILLAGLRLKVGTGEKLWSNEDHGSRLVGNATRCPPGGPGCR